jgi:hypothetical protein
MQIYDHSQFPLHNISPVYFFFGSSRELYRNNFQGSIPKELGNLENLISFDLYSNNLTGNIPQELENLKSLVFL